MKGKKNAYSFVQLINTGNHSHDILLILSFSGGGTRAAALSYGVLQELRDTMVITNGKKHQLLDEVDIISSVSGGSFTSAYYGVYGDAIFEDFEDAFLRNDFESPLIGNVLLPHHWFRDNNRTEMLIQMYEESVFHGATFADMNREGAPLIMINATDLSKGFRFSFIQEYFDLLCSDIGSYPVARAVAASSAVPLLFEPVVLKNQPHCKAEDVGWIANADVSEQDDEDLRELVDIAKSYHDKQKRPYIHYVDGGITDNLGLRAISEYIELSGGAPAILKRLHRPAPHTMGIISVDASTNTNGEINKSPDTPSYSQTIDAVTDTQLHRYNRTTNKMTKQMLASWGEAFSTPEDPVHAYFVKVRLRDLKTPEDRVYVNTIPTGFDLEDEQVDMLIEAGRSLLRDNLEFQRFLKDLH